MGTKGIFNAVIALDESMVTAKTQAKLDAGAGLKTIILNDGLIRAMEGR
jgi:hypothetical protein